MTSVNKIKQLAEAHEYDLAEPILDSQDLEKSFNPQFLRVCGEVYENVGRLTEARQMYVKAHSMAPEANRIIFSLINYYLKLGYFDLADRYFEEYVYYSSGEEQDLKNIRYIMKKGKGANPEDLYDILYPYYRDNIDSDWTFELILLSKILGKDDIVMLITDYKATFKNGRYVTLVDEIANDIELAVRMYYIYATAEAQDNNPEEAEIREIEDKQLKEDYFKMNPEAVEDTTVINSLVSDDPKEKISSENIEKGIKNFIKRKFKKKSGDDQDSVDEETDENAVENDSDSDDIVLTDADGSSDANGADVSSDQNDDIELSDVDGSEFVEGGVPEAAKKSGKQEFVTYEFDDGFAPESDTIAGLSDIDSEFESSYDSSNVFSDFEKFRRTSNYDVPVQNEEDEEPEVSYSPEPGFEAGYESSYEFEPEPEYESEPEPEYESEPESVSESEYESETESEYESEYESEAEYETESISEYETESEPEYESESEPEYESETESEYKPESEYETSEYESDDEDSESEPELIIESSVSGEKYDYDEPELSFDERSYESESSYETESEYGTNTEDDFTPDVEEDFETGLDKDYVEEASRYSSEVNEFETDLDENTLFRNTAVYEETIEDEPEMEASYEQETASETSYETENTYESEQSYENVSESESVSEPESEPEPSYMKYDFPEMDLKRFSSDYFPGMSLQETETHNRFEDVMKTESEKLDEGLKEEEAKLREAEALLASLGIKL